MVKKFENFSHSKHIDFCWSICSYNSLPLLDGFFPPSRSSVDLLLLPFFLFFRSFFPSFREWRWHAPTEKDQQLQHTKIGSFLHSFSVSFPPSPPSPPGPIGKQMRLSGLRFGRFDWSLTEVEKKSSSLLLLACYHTKYSSSFVRMERRRLPIAFA